MKVFAARSKRTKTPVWEVQVFDGKRIIRSVTVIGDAVEQAAHKVFIDRMNALWGNKDPIHLNEYIALRAKVSEQVQIKRKGVVYV